MGKGKLAEYAAKTTNFIRTTFRVLIHPRAFFTQYFHSIGQTAQQQRPPLSTFDYLGIAIALSAVVAPPPNDCRVTTPFCGGPPAAAHARREAASPAISAVPSSIQTGCTLKNVPWSRWLNETMCFASCTSVRMMPSLATWLSGQLGMLQTHASCDVVAACAGLPYGLSEAIRLLQEVERPVLVVCGEKFSDKIGTVRTSRMIFGDGAAALVVAPSTDGTCDVEYYQTYASGPMSEVDSIIWPNPQFDNNITVHGPEVRALVKRYLSQMLEEVAALPRPDGAAGSLLDAIDLVVPHQANQPMVLQYAGAAGLPRDRIYFNIDRVGNTSSASIPIAIHDAVHKELKDEHALLPRRTEGEREARWILLDYLDVILHVFVPETRERYRLEQLWGEASEIELDLEPSFGARKRRLRIAVGVLGIERDAEPVSVPRGHGGPELRAADQGEEGGELAPPLHPDAHDPGVLPDSGAPRAGPGGQMATSCRSAR